MDKNGTFQRSWCFWTSLSLYVWHWWPPNLPP